MHVKHLLLFVAEIAVVAEIVIESVIVPFSIEDKVML